MTRVSVILPTFNSQRTIARTLISVLNQTKKPYELIISDNQSSDNTLELVRKTLIDSTEIRYKLLTCATPGSGPNRNNAVMKASGEVLAFLDSDDVWDSNFLEQITKENIPSNCIRGAYARYSNTEGHIFGSSIRSKDDIDARDKMLGKGVMPFLLSTWVMNLERFIELGGFDENYFVAQDYEFMYRHLSSGGSLEVLRRPSVTYLIHRQSETTISHLQQRLTMLYVLSAEKDKIGLHEFLNKSKKNWKFRRWAYSDMLIRRFITLERNSFHAGVGFVLSAAVISPIRFFKKIFFQRPHRETS